MKKNYITKKRAIIERIFSENPLNSYTSKDIIRITKDTIGEATVYRNLSKLVEEGFVKKYIGSEKETVLYQYNPHSNCNDHFHLCCDTCGALIHMDCEFFMEMEEHMRNKHSFFINNTKTLIYGECEICRKKQKNLQED